MSIDVVGILVLGLIFLIGTWRSINLGALALVAAVLLGTGLAKMSLKEVYQGFPADLFVLLVGVTFLFGVATANGTVEWVVERAAHLVGDRRARVAVGAIRGRRHPNHSRRAGASGRCDPGALGLRLAQRYNINPVLAGLMIVHGSAVGNFSPINVLGAIVNQTMEREGLPSNPDPAVHRQPGVQRVARRGHLLDLRRRPAQTAARRNDEIDSERRRAPEDPRGISTPAPRSSPADRRNHYAQRRAVLTDTGTTSGKLSRPQIVTVGAVAVGYHRRDRFRASTSGS